MSVVWTIVWSFSWTAWVRSEQTCCWCCFWAATGRLLLLCCTSWVLPVLCWASPSGPGPATTMCHGVTVPRIQMSAEGSFLSCSPCLKFSQTSNGKCQCKKTSRSWSRPPLYAMTSLFRWIPTQTSAEGSFLSCPPCLAFSQISNSKFKTLLGPGPATMCSVMTSLKVKFRRRQALMVGFRLVRGVWRSQCNFFGVKDTPWMCCTFQFYIYQQGRKLISDLASPQCSLVSLSSVTLWCHSLVLLSGVTLNI